MSRKPGMHVIRYRPIFAFATQEVSVSLNSVRPRLGALDPHRSISSQFPRVCLA